MERYFDETFDHLSTVLNTEQMSIQLINQKRYYTFRKWRGLSSEYRNSVRNFHFWELEQEYFDPVFLEDTQTDCRVKPIKEILRKENINSGSSIPLVISNKFLGRFAVYFSQSHRFDIGEMQLLKTTAYGISIILELEYNKKILTESGALLVKKRNNELSGAIKIIHTKEKLLHEALAIAKLGYCEFDSRSHQLKCSDELLNMLGLKTENCVISLNELIETIYPGDISLMKFAVTEAIEKKKNQELIIRHLKDDLSFMYLNVKIKTIIEKGKSEKLVGTVSDITDYLYINLLKRTNPQIITNQDLNFKKRYTIQHSKNTLKNDNTWITNTKEKSVNLNQVLVRSGKKSKLIKTNDIEYITSIGNYTNISIVNEGKLTARKLLKEWLIFLPEENFLRIHRSCVINIAFIEDIEKWYNGSLKIKMKYSNKIFIASCRYSKLFRKKLKA